jgi:hypothetical protein
MKRLAMLLVLVSGISFSAPQAPGLETFLNNFTAEWMRGNPNGAASARFFTGEEQLRLERQITPESEAYRRERIALARKGLAELRKFDLSKATDTQRVSAELMEWQLDTLVREQP